MTLIERGVGGGLESPQLPLIRNRNARGTTTSAGGGGREETPAPLLRCHLSTRVPSSNTTKTTKIVQTSTRNPPQRQQKPNAIAAPGGRRTRGGGEGTPTPQRRCHLSTCGPSSNVANTTRRRAGHQHGLLLSDSMTERNRSARGTTNAGGGARGRLRRNAADTTRQRAGHQRSVEKY